MSKIKILPSLLINKIAAGEVVERPASVVKELIENSIDAGADQIFVTVKNGGKDLITILDNGEGMSAEDAKLAIERHATSKISQIEELDSIQTKGFRGEALAAIASVSHFEITTCHDEQEGGFQMRLVGGKMVHSCHIGFPRGTKISVENLFFNTPARKKFMKAHTTEYAHIYNHLINLSIAHPEIQFRLTHNQNLIFNLAKGETFLERVQYCLGKTETIDLIEIKHEEHYLNFHGLFSLPSDCKPNKRWQYFFVNTRHIRAPSLNHAVYEGYKTLLMKGIHPIFFIKIVIDPKEIDVNVHPAKTEIRLRNQSLVHTILSTQIAVGLKESSRKRFFVNQLDQEPLTLPASPQIAAHSLISQTTKQTPSERPQDLSFFDQLGIPPVKKYKVIGQFDEFMIAAYENQLWIIDKHAAHERIRFEEIRDQFYAKKIKTQPLVTPMIFQLPPQDGILLEQYADAWEQAGFVIDHFGGSDYSVKEVPVILKNHNIIAIIKDVLDEMAEFGKSSRIEIFFNTVFEKIACHSAIRGSQHMSTLEMQHLLDQLINLNINIHCPHGRPVMIEITKDELNKRFKRS